MTNRQIDQIEVDRFIEPIFVSLASYSQSTDGEVGFDLDAASRLVLTPDKPNTARSETWVTHKGIEHAAKLFVIAFANGDGTGDQKTFAPGQLDMGTYPDTPQYYPRSKVAAQAEAHLTIAATPADFPRDVVLGAGHLELLGLVGRHVERIGHVGQAEEPYAYAMRTTHRMAHKVTLTTGFRGELDGRSLGERFGDPHAVISTREDTLLQVCGFIAVGPEAAQQHLGLLRSLGAVEPVLAA